MKSPAHTPPKLSLSFTEFSRSGLEASRLLLQLNRLIKQAPKGDGHPVLALPGYGGGDGSMFMARHFLNKIGYNAYALELGRNYETKEEHIMRIEDAVAFRERMSAQVINRLEKIHSETGQPVTLLGWSMGGLYALDASQAKPELTKQVITLGTPFGDPRGTAAFKLLRAFNGSKVPLEEQNFDLWTNKTELKNNQVPIKVLHSHQDGIVGQGIARLPEHPNVEHILVDSSHIGFALNPKVLKLVADII